MGVLVNIEGKHSETVFEWHGHARCRVNPQGNQKIYMIQIEDNYESERAHSHPYQMVIRCMCGAILIESGFNENQT